MPIINSRKPRLGGVFSFSPKQKGTPVRGVSMRMNEKISSALSYFWNGVIGVFGSISADGYTVLIALAGMLLTAWINNYWQKKRFEKDYGDEAP